MSSRYAEVLVPTSSQSVNMRPFSARNSWLAAPVPYLRSGRSRDLPFSCKNSVTAARSSSPGRSALIGFASRGSTAMIAHSYRATPLSGSTHPPHAASMLPNPASPKSASIVGPVDGVSSSESSKSNTSYTQPAAAGVVSTTVGVDRATVLRPA